MQSLAALAQQFSAFVAVVAAFILNTSGSAQETSKGTKPFVLVPPFENLAKQRDYIQYDVADGTGSNRHRGRFRIDRYTEAPRALFEDALVNIGGVKVVERKRVDALLVEAEFGQLILQRTLGRRIPKSPAFRRLVEPTGPSETQGF